MDVLDASALIALLQNEPAADQVEALLRRRPPPAISAVNLAEALDQLVRVFGRDPMEVNDAIDRLLIAGLEVEPFWLPNARRAAAVRARYYHRTRSALSLADCAAIATAVALRAEIATTDRPLARAARDFGVKVVELPSSS
jgi:PIN domain nuclease of toxin-antitoxin system